MPSIPNRFCNDASPTSCLHPFHPDRGELRKGGAVNHLLLTPPIWLNLRYIHGYSSIFIRFYPFILFYLSQAFGLSWIDVWSLLFLYFVYFRAAKWKFVVLVYACPISLLLLDVLVLYYTISVIWTKSNMRETFEFILNRKGQIWFCLNPN